MNPLAALLVAGLLVWLLFHGQMARAPSRLILAAPTTVWPLTAVLVGLALAFVAASVITRLDGGVLATVAAAAVVLFVVVRPRRTPAPTRIVYERGGMAMLRGDLIGAAVLFGLVFFVLIR